MPIDMTDIMRELKKPRVTARRIVSAAMLMDDGLIVPGVRHFSPDMRAVLKRIYGKGFKLFGIWLKKPYHFRVKEQGFIDAKGNFLSREDAWRVAEMHGQIFLYNPMDNGELIPLRDAKHKPIIKEDEQLFSENLY